MKLLAAIMDVNQKLKENNDFIQVVQKLMILQIEEKQSKCNQIMEQQVRKQFIVKDIQLFEEECDYLDEIIEQEQQQLRRKDQLIQQAKHRIMLLEQQLRSEYQGKKKDNRILQQVKGNVRVFCRLRPTSQTIVDYQATENLITIRKDKKQLKSNNQIHTYEYLLDKVFDKDVSQQLLFNQISDLIETAMDGINVCFFAYGQTGSGKTFTMNGSMEIQSQKGIIPRSLQYIFNQVNNSESKGYCHQISISATQIYNNDIRDLLNKNESKAKRPFITQFTPVRNYAQAISLLKKGLQNRSTGKTEMNLNSSRSHLIFQIKNESKNVHDVSKNGSLVFVDLAGSESYQDAGLSEERQLESTYIKTSLNQLARIINSIKEGIKPIFRGCKLIQALQKQLEGDSKVVMFVNVSIENEHLKQTINSLKFTDSIRGCQIKKDTRITHQSLFKSKSEKSIDPLNQEAKNNKKKDNNNRKTQSLNHFRK